MISCGTCEGLMGSTPCTNANREPNVALTVIYILTSSRACDIRCVRADRQAEEYSLLQGLALKLLTGQ